MGQAADVQPIEEIAAAAVDEIPDLDGKIAVFGGGEIDERIAAEIVAGVGELLSLRIVKLQGAVELAVEPPGPAVNDDALPLLGGEDVEIDIGAAVHLAIDDDGEAHPLRLAQLVVRLLFLNFRQIADDESAEIGQPQGSDDANVIGAERNVLGDGDLEFAWPGGLGAKAGMAEVESGGIGQFAACDDAIGSGSLFAAAGEDTIEAGDL